MSNTRQINFSNSSLSENFYRNSTVKNFSVKNSFFKDVNVKKLELNVIKDDPNLKLSKEYYKNVYDRKYMEKLTPEEKLKEYRYDINYFDTKLIDLKKYTSVLTLKRRMFLNNYFPHIEFFKDFNFTLDDIRFYLDNPHLRGKITNTGKVDMEIIHLEEIDRFLSIDEEDNYEYQRRQDQNKTLDHWGQRKLLLTEMEFLTNYSEEIDLIVYIGCSPGSHIEILYKLFPNKFLFYDPRNIEFKLNKNDKFFKKPFTNSDAYYIKKNYNTDNVIIISDMRSEDKTKIGSDKIKNKQIKNDLDSQKRWLEIIKPKISSLKFRLPYPNETDLNDNFNYLIGDIYYQIWQGPTSVETRLIVSKDDIKYNYDYSKTWYENKLYEFNLYQRLYTYDVEDQYLKLGYDHCYDCRCEIFIIKEYIERFYPNYSEDFNFYKKIHNNINLCGDKNNRKSLILSNDIKNNKDFIKRLNKEFPGLNY